MVKSQILDIVPATLEHVEFMIHNLPDYEIEEIEGHGISVEDGIRMSFKLSDQIWVALAPEGPVCMWGIKKARTLLGSASAWMLTSNLIVKYARPFLKQAKPYVKNLVEQEGLIETYMDSRHADAVRFYEWLGFTIEGGILVGPTKIPFFKIFMRHIPCV